MDLSNVQILACPRCKGDLRVSTERVLHNRVINGNLFCRSCNILYSISDGIPNLYVSDEEAIKASRERRFPQLIITQEKLEDYDRVRKVKGKHHHLVASRKLPAFFMVFGWILLFWGLVEVLRGGSFQYLNSTVSFLLLLVAAFVFFAIDYYLYRSSSKSKYVSSLEKLRELSGKHKLSEYDIRADVKDDDAELRTERLTLRTFLHRLAWPECEPREVFEDQRSFIANKSAWHESVLAYKGAWIKSVLSAEEFDVNKSLNVGCGGSLQNSVSKPYFDRGYAMVGLDVSTEYLKEFAKEHHTDAILANSLALPFKPNTFDLVGFTDVLEHLHHPLLGLLEVNRVMNVGGAIILSTNNRCAIKSARCLNPLVLAEKILSLRFDDILPPRNILETWIGFQFYHTEFSKREITKLLETSGFHISAMETKFPTDKLRILNSTFGKIPFLKHLCSEFFIVAFKNQ